MLFDRFASDLVCGDVIVAGGSRYIVEFVAHENFGFMTVALRHDLRGEVTTGQFENDYPFLVEDGFEPSETAISACAQFATMGFGE